jgi:putrescine transport system permease protein
MLIPEVIIGLSLLLLFVNLEKLIGWPKGGFETITIAHATIAIAYVTAVVTTRLSSIDPLFLEAAQDLGAHPVKAFFVITLPLIYPSIISGWLLSFVLSFDDVVVASFVSGPESSTLPMVIFSSIRFGLTPQVNALATLMIVFVVLIIVGAAILNDRQKRILTDSEDLDESTAL